MKKMSLTNWPSYSKKEIAVVKSVLSSNKVNYWTGEEGRLFEEEFSSWCGSKYSIALANGTVALDLALKALDIKPGDEVIVTPRSFIASVSSVISVGAKPVFADVDIANGNLSAASISKVLTLKTKAIICVHLGGLPCEMDSIMKLAKKHNLYVIEDCAQAHGATYKNKSVGTIGDIGAWSFCQDKIMTTGGEGGMVTTNKKMLWKRMWSYKDHGKNYDLITKKNSDPGFKWIHDSFGTNWRMTEMQAAIGRIQLQKINRWNELRNRNADFLYKVFSKFPHLIEFNSAPSYINHAYYRVYVYLTAEAEKNKKLRNALIDSLISEGIPCFSGSCSEIYKEKAFKNTNYVPKKDLPNAKILGNRSIAFLCHPTLSRKDLKIMEEKITKVLSHF